MEIATAELSEIIEILLSGNPHGIFSAVVIVVVSFLCPDVKDHANGQEIEVRYGQANLKASEQEKRCCYFPDAWTVFFLDSISVTRFAPQSSRISGSTW